MRLLMLGLLSTLLLGGAQVARAADSGAPGAETPQEDTMGMPQVAPGNGSHPFCWMDIQAKDMQAAQKFYGELFGWSFQSFGGDDYAMYMPPAGLMGALTAKPEDLEAKQGCTPYLYTADFEGDVAALRAAGAQFTQEPNNVSGANVAVFLDAAGTQYGLIDTAPQLPIPHLPPLFGSPEHPPVGTLWSLELYGGDFEKARALFGERFGWGLLDTMPQYMMFDPGAGIGGVFQGHTAVIPALPYIWVDDVRAKLGEIVAAGGKQVGEPASMPGMGTFGYFTDPNGVSVGLIGPE